MAYKVQCAWIKKEQAAHRRALAKRGYEGLGHWCPGNLRKPCLEKERKHEAKLIAYAAALGVKRGLFKEGEAMVACVMLSVPGERTVGFYRVVEVKGRYGKEMRHEPGCFARVELKNLDWEPGEPVEEIVPEALAA